MSNAEAFHIPSDTFPTKNGTKQFLKNCLFDDMDLYDALKALHLAHHKSSCWSSLSIPIITATISELRTHFKEFSPGYQHLGLHDLVKDSKFSEVHTTKGEKVLVDKSILEIREYSKFGIPSSLRPAMWSKMLQSDIIDSMDSHVQRLYQELNQKIIKYDLMIDRIICLDAKHAQNDDAYFVFEEVICEVVLLWSRDTWITKQLQKLNPKLGNGRRTH